ncbi:DNA methyltransferase [Pontibacillus litoralis]|uniref:DNA methylase n=1 Tax=Pontibacillus litoralis JSM 072002 TaxID=1385512 RepID=A0A0A5G173_9BACI|nr:DNA methyltransferase [Pontibacillus litoralis]KGX84853.1 DNA methylase [Pontibacillus litoralis JSM 072002]
MTKENEQLSILGEEEGNKDHHVTVLGMTFNNDQERKEYFTEELRKKLPDLKDIEGFPIGEDEDILSMSDPPYYTACPNPWLSQMVSQWNVESLNKEDYQRLPFASDVSEGKNDAFYNAHGYHTKVPYKAILKYILHYTSPGDIIFDGFSGTGTTGVAANAAGNKKIIETLGYKVDENNNIYDNREFKSGLGKRNVILNDLSPSATLISYNYNSNGGKKEFEQEARRIIDELKKECLWMYKTKHSKEEFGIITNVVWSDIFICPDCSTEINFWDVSVDYEKKKMEKEFNCFNCNSKLEKKELERSWETYFDADIEDTVSIAKQVPVLINYSVGTRKYTKKVDEFDLSLLQEIQDKNFSYWYPVEKIPEGYNTKQPLKSHGISHVHQFYTRRNLYTLACLYKKIKESKFSSKLLFFFQASINRSTKTNRFRFGGTGGLSGTLYIPSLGVERNSIFLLESKLRDQLKVLEESEYSSKNFGIITQSSSTNLGVPENSVDYIFTDPPFGSNIMYSELNFLWESWLKVITNNKNESIINPVQNKGLEDYIRLMEKSFVEFYNILKPNRWMTVEFSNSQSSVWNGIREAIERAGFIIANVSALDKKQGSFKAVTSTTAVKQDLVISCYKPSDSMVNKLESEQGSKDSVWEFVKEHLSQLPVFIGKKGEADYITERTPRVLFDRMVAYHVQHGYIIPISSAEFQEGVQQRFPIRDGMAFLENQVAEYDKQRTIIKEFTQVSLFVSDENSAIEWIRQQLLKKPQTRQDLHPGFMKEIQHIDKHELLPELDVLLEQNFLMYEGTEGVPDQIVGYLRKNYKDLRSLDNDNKSVKSKAVNRWYVPDVGKQSDLEKLREKSLLREFESYLEYIDNNRKKLKQFRTEAIRAGFKKAWGDKDYQKIVDVGQRLPEKVVQEDDKLLMYFDNAQIRLGM